MKYYCDGYTLLDNPSRVGGGYSIVDESGKLITHQVIKQEGFTNNDAEIQGALATLEMASEGDTISTDSFCVITWINGGKSKARPDLLETLQRCKKLREEKKINLTWEGRDFNLAGHFNEKFDSGKKMAEKHKARIARKREKIKNATANQG